MSKNVQNILNWYDLSTELDKSIGKGWYQDARQQCLALAEKHGADPQRTIWAVAALSPQVKWETNVKTTDLVMSGRMNPPGAYASNVEKAMHILFDETDWQRWLSGPKVTSFARNISGDPDTVTVDMWAWRIWEGTDNLRAQPRNLAGQYDTIADDYRQAAAQLGLEPRQLQAITWTTIRRVANGRTFPGQLSLDI